LCPRALARAHRSAPLSAVYLQPTLHNPCGTTMPPERRAELAAALEHLDLHAVEDRVWAFLLEDAPGPLPAHAPERTVVVDSLSQRPAPGPSVRSVVPPGALAGRVASALRAGGWGPQAFAREAAAGWIAAGTAEAVARAKRADASARMRIAAERLPGAAARAGACSYFLWWELPSRWRAETFVAAAARRGIAVTPGAAFAAGPGQGPAGWTTAARSSRSAWAASASGPSAHRLVTGSEGSGRTRTQRPSPSATRTPSVVSIVRPPAASTTCRITLPLAAHGVGT